VPIQESGGGVDEKRFYAGNCILDMGLLKVNCLFGTKVSKFLVDLFAAYGHFVLLDFLSVIHFCYQLLPYN